MPMWIKVCGVTAPAEIAILKDFAVRMVGVWHGVEGGHADLPADRFCQIAGSIADDDSVEPVLVTFINDADRLGDLIAKSGIQWVQLHAFQPPSLVQTLKRRFGTRLGIIKVLHLRRWDCLEQGLIGAYERAGTDVFLLDAATAEGRIGSTGRALDGEAVSAVANRLTRPFLLAGGISADIGPDQRRAAKHPRFLGIDVDSGARGDDRAFDRSRLEKLIRSWTSLRTGDRQHAVEFS
jgi:phosphoribosylanthranilate isomerase